MELLSRLFDLVRYRTMGKEYMAKPGYNPAIGAAFEPIWAESGVAYTYPAAAQAMTISSASGNDASGGTGLRSVYIEGLDANWNRISETTVLFGTSGVALANQYLRVTRCYGLTWGSGGVNAGIVYIGYGTVTAGKPATVQLSIEVGKNQALQAIYSVPAGKTALLRRLWFSLEKAGRVALYARPFGGGFLVQREYPTLGGIQEVRYDLPLSFPEKSDIEVRGLVSSAPGTAAAEFEIVLV